ncbi:MAG: uridine kinase family protein [Oscillospiraceae bacterium]|jgi:uridine kinase
MSGKDFAKQNKRLDASAINRLCEQDMTGLIDAAENAYLETIRSTVERYLDGQKLHKMILISGPSGSGKTTTSYRLTDELKQHGLNPVVLSLDNFFKQPSEMRRNPDGSIRYDSVHSINLGAVNRTLWSLMYHGEAILPRYDFLTARASEKSELLKIDKDSVVLIEGLHALNPLLTYGLDYGAFFKICMNVDSAFVDGDETVLTSREVRFVRRAIRDYRHRGASVDVTFGMWPGVCEGEDLYIRPFYPYADVMLNTVYSYEPLVYKPLLAPLLMALAEHETYGPEALQLYRKLLHFGEIPVKKVPVKSLLQEFVG